MNESVKQQSNSGQYYINITPNQVQKSKQNRNSILCLNLTTSKASKQFREYKLTLIFPG